jgi:hypothetical protein
VGSINRSKDEAQVSNPAWRNASSSLKGSGGGRRWFVVGSILALEILLWVAIFGVGRLFHDGPNGKGMGTDFAVFSGAASALQHGQNPYDYQVLYRSEYQLLRRQHVPVTTNKFNVRAGNPPLFYWALGPLTSLPFQRVAWAWIITMYLFSAAGFLLALRYLRWTSWLVPAIVFLLMPEVVTGALYGNVHGPVFAALALCLVLMDRYPTLAGVIAAFGWLKPQLALPLVLMIFVFHATDRMRMAAGFMAATAIIFGLTVLTTGIQSISEWIGGLNNWSQGIAKEPNIASLSGLYVGWASRPAQLAIASVLLLMTMVLTGATWRRLGGRGYVSLVAVGWLWALWFLVSPFTHYPDVIVLTLPVLALLGRNGEWASTPLGVGVLYLSLFSLVLFPTPLVSLAVVAIGVMLARAARAGGALRSRESTAHVEGRSRS